MFAWTQGQWGGLAVTGNTFLKLSAHARLKIVVSACGRSNIYPEFAAAIVIKLHILSLSPCWVCSSLSPCERIRPDDWDSLRSNLFSSICGIKPSGANKVTPAVLSLTVTVGVQLLGPVCLLHDLTDCSPPGSSVHGVFQARTLEWVAISFFRGSSPPRDRTGVSCTAGRISTTKPPGKPWARW